MKLAGIGAAIEKRSVLPTSHLWTHRDPPKLATLKARTALLLLVIYYGHINPRPSPANPSGLSVEPQTFAQLLLHEAHNLLKDLDWGCISNKSALLGINPILLYGFHCFENQEKWPAFEPIITKAINADRSPTSTEKKKSLHALGEDPTLFHSNSLKQQIWRRATFALIVLASLGSLAHYEISAAELELPLPLNIRYTDIEENNHILETVEAMEELSDAGLLIMNGRLAIAKSRLVSYIS
ncbi:hypothetical protein SISSUDRAFT_406206 [Sistotremastrum suecicum HHB10207 ss-3]|uniref:Uncharacterized protein n=1 Tax=Sistotremastrum suecicum HHB10207 ss-3 TaxID=1314776 RepID=A0A165YQW6_9AGAM|nr:hypothetical protein SISSUDRAFT_406206 [Sistotremastrum suecicum HHB10207 ss-3]